MLSPSSESQSSVSSSSSGRINKDSASKNRKSSISSSSTGKVNSENCSKHADSRPSEVPSVVFEPTDVTKIDARAFAYIIEDAFLDQETEEQQENQIDNDRQNSTASSRVFEPTTHQDYADAPRRLQRQRSSQFYPIQNPNEISSLATFSRQSSTFVGAPKRHANLSSHRSDSELPPSTKDRSSESSRSGHQHVFNTSSHSLPTMTSSQTPAHQHVLTSSMPDLQSSSSKPSAIDKERIKKFREEQQRILEQIQRSSSVSKTSSEHTDNISPEMTERIRVMKEQQHSIMEKIRHPKVQVPKNYKKNKEEDLTSSGLGNLPEFVIQEQYEILSQIFDSLDERNNGSALDPPSSELEGLNIYERVTSQQDVNETEHQRLVREQQAILEEIQRQRH